MPKKKVGPNKSRVIPNKDSASLEENLSTEKDNRLDNGYSSDKISLPHSEHNKLRDSWDNFKLAIEHFYNSKIILTFITSIIFIIYFLLDLLIGIHIFSTYQLEKVIEIEKNKIISTHNDEVTELDKKLSDFEKKYNLLEEKYELWKFSDNFYKELRPDVNAIFREIYIKSEIETKLTMGNPQLGSVFLRVKNIRMNQYNEKEYLLDIEYAASNPYNSFTPYPSELNDIPVIQGKFVDPIYCLDKVIYLYFDKIHPQGATVSVAIGQLERGTNLILNSTVTCDTSVYNKSSNNDISVFNAEN